MPRVVKNVGPELKATSKIDGGQTATIKRRENPLTKGIEWISHLSVNQQNLRGKNKATSNIKREAMLARDQDVGMKFITEGLFVF